MHQKHDPNDEPKIPVYSYIGSQIKSNFHRHLVSVYTRHGPYRIMSSVYCMKPYASDTLKCPVQFGKN